jgi:hypothetical protein
VVFCSATFFCARKNASHFSLSGAKKRRLQPERYAQVVINWLGILDLIILVYKIKRLNNAPLAQKEYL